MKRPAPLRANARLSTLIQSVGILILVLAAAGAFAAAESGSESDQIRNGRLLYRHFCRSCHGDVGQGDGPVAEYLTVEPTDLTQLARENGGEYPFEKIVKIIDGRHEVRPHGAEMPVWGDAFHQVDPGGDEEGVRRKVDALTRFLESIQAETGP